MDEAERRTNIVASKQAGQVRRTAKRREEVVARRAAKLLDRANPMSDVSEFVPCDKAIRVPDQPVSVPLVSEQCVAGVVGLLKGWLGLFC